jgi:ATP-dependent DNA ligase
MGADEGDATLRFDAAADGQAMTPDLAPMEMRSVATIPDGPQWQYEPKWDGFRAIVHRTGDDIQIVSKNGLPLGRYFPEIVAALAALAHDGFTLDGEIVVPEAGILSFDALQQRMHPAASRVAMLAKKTPALLLVFDLLREDDIDVLQLPLRERRVKLEHFAQAFERESLLRLSPATSDRRADLGYASGKRDAAVKIKKTRTADCVIGGFRYAAGARDRVGSLLLGLYDGDGLLDYIGFCSAFAAPERKALLARLKPYEGGSGFSGGAPDTAPSRWNRDPDKDRSYVALAPQLVLEVAFDLVTSGRIRHGTKPVRWRTDKSPQTCSTEQLETAGSVLGLLGA